MSKSKNSYHISKNIPLDYRHVLYEITSRQDAQWNSSIYKTSSFPTLRKLFELMNSGIPEEDFFYRGNLYRIHPSHKGCVENLDESDVVLSARPCEDACDDCASRVFVAYTPKVEYSDILTSFSKNYDFTRGAWYKLRENNDYRKRTRMFHVDTKNVYGIDVNAFLARFASKARADYINRFHDEYEVLFPLQKEYVVKEYLSSPYQFKAYHRHKSNCTDV